MKLNDELFGIIDKKFGRQLWGLCKIKKDCNCRECEKPLKDESGFRPLTNSGNRTKRLCIDCAKLLAEDKDETM